MLFSARDHATKNKYHSIFNLTIPFADRAKTEKKILFPVWNHQGKNKALMVCTKTAKKKPSYSSFFSTQSFEIQH